MCDNSWHQRLFHVKEKWLKHMSICLFLHEWLQHNWAKVWMLTWRIIYSQIMILQKFSYILKDYLGNVWQTTPNSTTLFDECQILHIWTSQFIFAKSLALLFYDFLLVLVSCCFADCWEKIMVLMWKLQRRGKKVKFWKLGSSAWHSLDALDLNKEALECSLA